MLPRWGSPTVFKDSLHVYFVLRSTFRRLTGDFSLGPGSVPPDSVPDPRVVRDGKPSRETSSPDGGKRTVSSPSTGSPWLTVPARGPRMDPFVFCPSQWASDPLSRSEFDPCYDSVKLWKVYQGHGLHNDSRTKLKDKCRKRNLFVLYIDKTKRTKLMLFIETWVHLNSVQNLVWSTRYLCMKMYFMNLLLDEVNSVHYVILCIIKEPRIPLWTYLPK